MEREALNQNTPFSAHGTSTRQRSFPSLPFLEGLSAASSSVDKAQGDYEGFSTAGCFS
ncbi:hypothetical protein CLOSTMETH_00393 [[Clostridium] methylpentosum DSM 5476]|uniref:Uncharacterized protein n=1 Tax=[Clostridium] methylpentosum DSM 5476 TaxID=537013 RepID=C0E995_9FIRM|nr:hypothetical protein CLOSTMETH_00393 [[Clostridium] methylpentosum DSM 5476]